MPYSKEELFEAFRMKDFLVQKEAKKSHAPRTNIGNASSPLPKTIMSRSEIARLRDAVMTINPDCSYDEWIRVGMGLRYELGEGGFELWDLWSSSGQKYKQHEMRSKWESFNA